MVTFAILIYKTDQREDGDFPVSIRVIHQRKSVLSLYFRYIFLGLKVRETG